jgi:hypothetical protein
MSCEYVVSDQSRPPNTATSSHQGGRAGIKRRRLVGGPVVWGKPAPAHCLHSRIASSLVMGAFVHQHRVQRSLLRILAFHGSTPSTPHSLPRPVAGWRQAHDVASLIRVAPQRCTQALSVCRSMRLCSAASVRERARARGRSLLSVDDDPAGWTCHRVCAYVMKTSHSQHWTNPLRGSRARPTAAPRQSTTIIGR